MRNKIETFDSPSLISQRFIKNTLNLSQSQIIQSDFIQKTSSSRFEKLKNSNYEKHSLKKKENKFHDKSRRYTIELNEFEKKFVLFKDINIENKDKKSLFEKV